MSRIVEMKTNALSRNDRKAALLRAAFTSNGCRAINMVSSPGTGKTELLTLVLKELVERDVRVAALVADCATDNDAKRLSAAGAPVRQITTQGMCHLEASIIDTHLGGWDLAALDLIIIENIGNLVCPAAFDLGEELRVALLSVTEGEDKPLKYPQMFHSADVIIITKIDLAEPCAFDREAAYAALETVAPGTPIFETSARDLATIGPVVDLFIGDTTTPTTSAATRHQA